MREKKGPDVKVQKKKPLSDVASSLELPCGIGKGEEGKACCKRKLLRERKRNADFFADTDPISTTPPVLGKGKTGKRSKDVPEESRRLEQCIVRQTGGLLREPGPNFGTGRQLAQGAPQ